MLTWAYDLKRLYRWVRAVDTSAYGSTEVTWTLGKDYLVNMVPAVKSRTPTEAGLVENAPTTAIIEGFKDFAVGDRLGSDVDQEWEVVSVQTFRTGQQLEVKPCLAMS